ncbi:MAG TPA: PLP-dependent transferase [Kiritimatiellia bacterium]|nr:PLP-dependent transferase [Kiritimatiellia bacterium]
MTPDQELWKNPRWRPEDLGMPLPESAHANSVCLPEWRDVIDYEEKDPRVIERLQAGYPRFVVPPACGKLFELCRERFALANENCHAYPTERSARRCAEMITRWSGHEARVVPWPEHSIYVVCFSNADLPSASKFWRHTGEGISSRRAEAILNGKTNRDSINARVRLKQRISDLSGAPEDCIYLFKSGMAAIYTLYRVATRLQPDGACVQYGFPYVDTLKIHQDFGFRSAFFPLGNATDLKTLARISLIDRLSAIFCEFPSNPLLNSPDINTLSQIARAHTCPLIVDDTISSWVNTNLLAHVDATVTSLTKYFGGRGDVMAGVAILNPDSPLWTKLRTAMNTEYEDCMWGENLILLEEYSRDFKERVDKINRTTEQVCDWLATRPEVKKVYYPKFETPDKYNAFKRPGGGYSGLFSIVLKESSRTTPLFYNRLEISKGPNLGTTFSLCCPFTLLAHYDELDWAEKCGVSRNLLRFSIGLEEPEDLIARLERAFSVL